MAGATLYARIRRCASPRGALLPDRPWLLESILTRAPMIHPLNLLQIEVLGRPRLRAADASLLRETITGIAAGMLTTG
jgi:phosphoenolpyruvate carboxylase